MVSSQQILERTGLKSAKTLTRWHQHGIIPQPVVRTHPSGRGKMAYWPDWVLDRCVRIVELQRQGHSLKSAVQTLEMERFSATIDYAQKSPPITDILDSTQFTVSEGRKISMHDVFMLSLLQDVKRLITDTEFLRVLASKIRESKSISFALEMIQAGYNPIMLFDRTELHIVPDFVVGYWLSGETHTNRTYLMISVLPAVRRAFASLGKELKAEPKAWPAPKLWAQDGDATMEYMFYPAGPLGFEVIRETAKVINVSSGISGGHDVD
jgi:hypothetical protein